MKRFFLYLFLPLLLVAFVVGIHGFLKPDISMPMPTDVESLQEEGADRKEARKAWIEAMHRAAPGVDWRKADDRTRWQKARKRFALYAQQNRSRNSRFAQDTLAQGNIWGHWREVGSGNQAGRIHHAAYDSSSNSIYLASSGGHIWKGPLQGNKWTVQNDLYRIRSINMLEVLPIVGGSRILVASGNGSTQSLLYSEDEGHSWQAAHGLENINQYNWGGIRRGMVVQDSIPIVYLLANEWDGATWSGITALYRSVDKGLNFSKLDTFHQNANRIDFWAHGSEVFVIRSKHVYRLTSNDSLVLTGTLPASPTGNVLITGSYVPSHTTLYALYRNGSGSDIFRSTNNGQTWAYQSNVGSGTFRRASFYADPEDSDKLFVGGIDVHRSTNAGQSWALVNSWGEYYGSPATKLHADIPEVRAFNDQNGNQFWLVSTDGGTYISRDDLFTVSNISLQGLHVSQYYSTYTDETFPDIIHLGSQDQGYQKGSIDDHQGARDFNQVISGDYGHLVSGDSGATLWMNYPGFTNFYYNPRSSGGKSTWQFVSGMGALWIPPVIADPTQYNRAYLAGGTLYPNTQVNQSHIIKLEYFQGGILPTELPFDFSNGRSATLSGLAISPKLSSIWYACTDRGQFYYSYDSGNSWTMSVGFSTPSNHYFYGNKILPSQKVPNRVFIAGSGYSNPGVYYSEDAGRTFHPMADSLPATMIFDIAATPDDSLIFAATELGPYMFSAVDSLWHEMEALSAPDQTYWTVEYLGVSQTVRFGTYGRGVWDYVICSQGAPQTVADFSPYTSATTVVFNNLSQHSNYYLWDFGDGNTSRDPNPVHVYNDSALYQVRLIAGNYCGEDTIIQEVGYLNTALDRDLQKGEVTLYPNPSDGHFFLENTSANYQEIKLQILDVNGRVVKTAQRTQWNRGQTWEIDAPDLAMGVYQVIVASKAGDLGVSHSLVIRN